MYTCVTNLYVNVDTYVYVFTLYMYKIYVHAMYGAHNICVYVYMYERMSVYVYVMSHLTRVLCLRV